MEDIYQLRYEEHIENKLKRKQVKNSYNQKTKDSFLEVMFNRKSVRRFNDNELNENISSIIDFGLRTAPSSCNRKAIYFEEVFPEYAEKVLVGGKNWVNKANRVYFMFGAKKAYKNPKEVSYMPYLDAGFVAQNIYLLCELNSVGCCFINPNLKEPIENEDYFVGAMAFGDYDI